eukprot:4873726-Amphidinium_carterae.1
MKTVSLQSCAQHEAECASGSASSLEEGKSHAIRTSRVKALPGRDEGELGDLPDPAASSEEQLSFKQIGVEMTMQPTMVEGQTTTRSAL